MTQQSIPGLFREQVAKLKARPMVYAKHDRHWRPLTWAQMGDRVLQAASGLVALGIEPGDRVAIYSASGVRWVMADLASSSAGAVNAPIYEQSTPEQVHHILRDCEAKVAFVNGLEELKIIEGARGRLPALNAVVYLARGIGRPMIEGLNVLSLHELESLSRSPEAFAEVDRRVAALKPDDLLTIIYTSGTMGEPKGVMLTHGGILANCEATSRAIAVRADDVVLSFLPLSHAFERTASYYAASLFCGATIYFAEGLGRLFHNLREVRPTLVTGVPRVFEKLYSKFLSRRTKMGFLQRNLVDWALSVGRKVSRLQQQGRTPGPLLAAQYRVAEDQVFSTLKARVGGRIRFMVSGGAPLGIEVAEFFHAAGILVLEGYGLTEASPVISVNRPDAYRFGTVGQLLDNVRLRIAEDGEILVRGPNVMEGYLNLPEATAEVLNEAGWLRTGDVGSLDRDGFLSITDRKKDLFKTAGGKYIAPQRLEMLLGHCQYIEQACVTGDRRPYCVALLVPAFPQLEAWAHQERLRFKNRAQLLRAPAVQALFGDLVEGVNRALSRHETIKSFRLLDEPFSVENGRLTASHKLRRKVVCADYEGEIDALYRQTARRRRR